MKSGCTADCPPGCLQPAPVGSTNRWPENSGGGPSTNIEAFDALARDYDRIYEAVDWEAFARQWQILIEPMLGRPLQERPTLLAEIGCGTGRLLREWISLGYDVLGVDASVAMLEIARQRLSEDEGVKRWSLELGDLRAAGGRHREVLADVAVAPMNFVHLFAPDDLPLVFSGIASFVRPKAPLLFDFAAPGFIRETGPVDEEFAPGVRIVAEIGPTIGELRQRWLLADRAVGVRFWLHEVAAIRQAAVSCGWRELGVWYWAPEDSAHPWKVWKADSPRGVFAFARREDTT